jgi:CubicO group peptidase (beta-lactamase class C family)
VRRRSALLDAVGDGILSVDGEGRVTFVNRAATALLGWSATKSVVNALTGILVRQGRLSVGDRAAVPEWRDPSDPRHAITVDHLLQMRSGLAFPETHTGFDPVSHMLYLEPDMAAFAARARLRARPGSEWQYTSGNTLILSRLLRDAVGGRPRDVLRFAYEELFGPLGMHTPVLEFDAAGTPIGSTYLFASARDWARFGLLYLRDGTIDGRRILPEGWVRYSSTPTPGSSYAAGFWTAQADWGVPSDALLARGFLGQVVAIVPSQRLVLARFGAIHRMDGDMDGLGRLLREVIEAVR